MSAVFRYLQKHWRGEFSLPFAFWVNFVAINLATAICQLALMFSVDNPVIASRITLVFTFFGACIVYPWQFVGVWRSAAVHARRYESFGWSGTAQGFLLLGLAGTVVTVYQSFPAYRDLAAMGFMEDQYADYSLTLSDNGHFLHVKGGMGFGISSDLETMLDENVGIRGIILDSRGGRTWEGRQISELIRNRQLDTYSFSGCYSACTTAFVAGTKRFLAENANLAFHRYRSYSDASASTEQVEMEQELDTAIFAEQGIASEFTDRMFAASGDDLWYPTRQEMRDAGVFHGTVSPSALVNIDYEPFSRDDLEAELAAVAVFTTLKEHEPEVYESIVTEMEAGFYRGESLQEIKGRFSSYIEALATRALPTTSDAALIEFAHATTGVLGRLLEINPILCVKNLYPEKYGGMNISLHLDDAELAPMLQALDRVFYDSYSGTNPVPDDRRAQTLMAILKQQIGDDIQYLQGTQLDNREDYKKACNTTIDWFDNILAVEHADAANFFRYMYSR